MTFTPAKLQGSEKQIKWAEDIRAKYIEMYETECARFEDAKQNPDSYLDTDEDGWEQKWQKPLNYMKFAIENFVSAKTWIDHRTNMRGINYIAQRIVTNTNTTVECAMAIGRE